MTLFPRMKAAGTSPEQIESGYELLTEAAGMLGRQDDAAGYPRKLVAARLHRLGKDAPATLAAHLTLSVVLEQAGTREEAAAFGGILSPASNGAIRASMSACSTTPRSSCRTAGKLDSAAEMFGRLVQAQGDRSYVEGLSGFPSALAIAGAGGPHRDPLLRTGDPRGEARRDYGQAARGAGRCVAGLRYDRQLARRSLAYPFLSVAGAGVCGICVWPAWIWLCPPLASAWAP
jgi:hypothetical protein